MNPYQSPEPILAELADRPRKKDRTVLLALLMPFAAGISSSAILILGGDHESAAGIGVFAFMITAFIVCPICLLRVAYSSLANSRRD